jgi:hypothetical protein
MTKNYSRQEEENSQQLKIETEAKIHQLDITYTSHRIRSRKI